MEHFAAMLLLMRFVGCGEECCRESASGPYLAGGCDVEVHDGSRCVGAEAAGLPSSCAGQAVVGGPVPRLIGSRRGRCCLGGCIGRP